MKKLLSSAIVIVLTSTLFYSCTKSKPSPAEEVKTNADVTIKFISTANGAPIIVGDNSAYTTTTARFTAEVVKFYISNASIVSDVASGSKVTGLNNFSLIDMAEGGKRGFTFKGLPNGTYNNLKFNLGVSKSYNSSPTGPEDLNSAGGMYWGESVGYLFFRHEGTYFDASNQQQKLLYHYGTNDAFPTGTNLELSSFKVEGKPKTITIALDLSKLYYGVDIVSFPFCMSDLTVPADKKWVETLVVNFNNSFSIKSIE